MWGSDYPHKESSTPFSREAMRAAFAGVPHDEVAAHARRQRGRVVRLRPRRRWRRSRRSSGRWFPTRIILCNRASCPSRRTSARPSPGNRRASPDALPSTIGHINDCRQRPVPHHRRRQPRRAADRASTASTSTQRFHPQFDEFLAERAAALEAIDEARRAQREVRQAVVRGARRGARRRLGRDQARPGARRRRRRRPRSSTPTPTRSRAARACRSAPGLGLSGDLDPGARHGRREGAQPLAGRAVRAQPRAPLRRRARADHRRRSTTCSPRSAGRRSPGSAR